ncbi:MAG: hypothetical protein ACTSQJ_14980 [Promethearchaeota archaeon]
MGILSKLFNKKIEENFQQIELDLKKLKKKTNAEIIAIIGTGGRLKGLPLIFVSDDETELKKFSARINELIIPLDNLAANRIFQDLVINFNNSILFFKKILKNIGYFALFQDRNNILPIKQWLYKKEVSLKDLLHD